MGGGRRIEVGFHLFLHDGGFEHEQDDHDHDHDDTREQLPALSHHRPGEQVRAQRLDAIIVATAASGDEGCAIAAAAAGSESGC